MNNFYLDTNFFIYLANNSSPYYKDCVEFIKQAKKKELRLVTSVETIQEIIHYTKNIKQPEKGLSTARKTIQLVDELIAIKYSTIEIYLKKARLHKSVKSRDLIHLAVCLENKIKKIVTYDKEFKAFKGVKILTPQEILTN